MKGFFKYKTLEDLYLHASDEMSGFAKEAADTNFHKENFYAAGLLFCSPDWQEVRGNQGENLNIKNKYDKKEIKRNICILPKDDVLKPEEIVKSILEVNDFLKPEDILSDHPYYYELETGKIKF